MKKIIALLLIGAIAIIAHPKTSEAFPQFKTGFAKKYTKKGTDHSLEAFRPLLDGTTNWPAVLEAFDAVGYDGYLTFEYFHPYRHFPEALIHHTSDSLDRMLGRGSG